MTAVAGIKTIDATSQPYSRLRHIRQKIARKEAEVVKVVDQARRNSDRRLLVRGGKLDAEDELEQALLERTILKDRSSAAAESLSKASPLLEQASNARRIDLLAASPPFVMKLEQALATVATVDRAAVPVSPGAHKRWRSSLKRLMKDASDGMDRYKHLAGHGEAASKEVESELALAAASARRLSTHVNAWSTLQLALELEGIWLQVVLAVAKDDAKFQHLVEKWQEAREALGACSSAVGDAAVIEEAQRDTLVARIRDCQLRAGVGPKAKRADWRKRRDEHYLSEELRHLERKMAPLASPSHMKARYNVLLAKCAEAGAWTIAVAAYRSMGARGIITKDCKTCNAGRRFPPAERFSLERGVFQYLLRAAKNASPPRPHLAVLVLQEMRSIEEEPSAIHYNIVISACARAAEAAAASTSLLPPLENTEPSDVGGQRFLRLPRGVGDNVTREGGGGEKDDMGQGGQGGICHNKSVRQVVPLLSASTNEHQRGVETGSSSLGLSPAIGCTDNSTRQQSLLSTSGPILACRDPETAEGAWRLALTVVGDMRKRGLAPTKGTYEAMVECCRYAGTSASCVTGPREEGERDSTPASVYATLKEAGIPPRFCYEAGLGNALRGGRRFPEYAEIHR